MTNLKDSGDEAFRLGYQDVASLTYGKCLTMLEQTGNYDHQMKDLAMRTRCGEMYQICSVNQILSSFSKCLSAQNYLDLSRFFDQNGCSLVEKRKLLHYRAIGLSQIDQPRKARPYQALEILDRAINLGSPYSTLEEDRAMMHRYLDRPSGSALILTPLGFRDLFGGPVTLKTPARISSTSIASERYLLKRLGYEGDLLEHIQESAPADVENMERLALQVEKQMAEAPAGQAWGLYVNMIGPTTRWRRLIKGRHRIILYSQ